MIEVVARFETDARYYRVFVGRDLLGDYTLIRAWGGKGSRRGGCSIELCVTAADVERRRIAIARRRVQRGYRPGCAA